MYHGPMSDEMRPYRDTLTGKIGPATADQASVFPKRLIPVTDEDKPYIPGMFTPGFVGEVENQDPPTDAELEAQARLAEALEEGSPRTKKAREARAAAEVAEREAEEARAAAAREAEEAEAERVRLAEVEAAETPAPTGEGNPETEGEQP